MENLNPKTRLKFLFDSVTCNREELQIRLQESYGDACFSKTQPLNKEHFIKRLKTFVVHLWTHCEPSPYLIARYGWKLIEPNVLQCVTCEVLLITELPDIKNFYVYKVFLEKLISNLINQHKSGCGWPVTPSLEEYILPDILNISKLELINKIKQFSCHTLPRLDITLILEKLELEHDNFCNIMKESIESEINLIPFLLVICGWSGYSQSSLKCSTCCRTVSLENFADSESPSSEEKMIFDPLAQHCHWCWWLSKSNDIADLGYKVVASKVRSLSSASCNSGTVKTDQDYLNKVIEIQRILENSCCEDDENLYDDAEYENLQTDMEEFA